MLRHHLTLAEEHVALGRKHIASQRRIIAELKRDGHPSGIAEEILVTFESAQKMHVEDRDRILSEIAGLDRRGE